MLCNHTSRFDVAIAAIRGGAAHNPRVAVVAHEAESYIKHMAQKERAYIYQHGKGQVVMFIICFWLIDLFFFSLYLDHDYIFDTPKFEGR